MHTKISKINLILILLCMFSFVCLLVVFFAMLSAQHGCMVAAALDLKDIPNIHIVLKYQGHSFVYNSCEHLPLITNYLDERRLQKNNRAGTYIERASVIQYMVEHNIPIYDAFRYMFFEWNNYMQRVEDYINIEPLDASIQFTPNNQPYFKLTKERIGCYVDRNILMSKILTEMHNTDCIVLDITPKKLLPNVYISELSPLTNKLSSFTTNYANSSASRKTNIRLALANFNGLEIAPKHTISFNNMTGKRTEEQGYKLAHVILDNDYVDAVGGGVCQASTTLYNALIRAGVQIDEVHSHSLPSSYVDLGFDAMVNYGSSDLRFTNQYDTPIFIRTVCNNDNIKVEIYGKNYSQNVRIRCKNEIISKITPPNDKIIEDMEGEYLDVVEYKDEYFYKKYPKDGYKVNAYIEYYAPNGNLLKRKLIRVVTYKAQQGIKVFGAKNRPKENNTQDFLKTLSNILGKV